MKNTKNTDISANAYKALYFGQPLTLRHLNEFYRVPELLFTDLTATDVEALDQKGKGALTQIINKVEKNIMGSREIIDYSDTEERLPENLIPILKKIQGFWENNELIIKPKLSGVFDFIQKSNRTTVTEIRNLLLEENTEFFLRSGFNLYWEEKYSLAWRTPDFGLALYTASAAGGGKGQARVLVKVLQKDALYIDNGAKYFDVTSFLVDVNI